MPDLGELELVSVRSHWADEARDFTPWLADAGLPLLEETLRTSLLLEGTEQAVGPYWADIVCLDGAGEGEERRVVIENQFGRSDHGHLGKIMTYIAGKDAFTAVWVAEEFSDEHTAAFEWLNEHTGPTKAFWALAIQLWRIGDSLPAPRFNVIVAPNPVTKAAHAGGSEVSDQRGARLSFWEGFHDYLAQEGVVLSVSKAVPETWVTNSIGRTGVSITLLFTNYDLVEQRFTADQVTRVELVLGGPRASDRYAELLVQRAAIDEEMGAPPLVWYDKSAKERKLLRQRTWPAGEEVAREELYAWLLEQVQQFRTVLTSRVLALQ